MRHVDRFEVFVECPLTICMERDKKGSYLKSQLGESLTFPWTQSPTKRQPTRISESTALPLHQALFDGPQAAHATFLQNDARTWCDDYESK